MRLVTCVCVCVCVAVEMLQALVNSSLGGAVGQQVACTLGNMGPVCLPRRAETFGGFDSHQMNICKRETFHVLHVPIQAV